MRLTKSARAELREMFGGLCAYCGSPLSARWHADHVAPLFRRSDFVGGRFVPTGEVHRPENDRRDNLMPACLPCNIDKSVMTVEQWRAAIERRPGVLRRSSSAYRHALRFGLVVERPGKVVFHFERVGDAARQPGRGECE